jgi:flagellar protein FliS
MISNPYQQYKEQSLATLAPGELLVRLFDEALKQLRLSCIGIGKKDYGMANDALNKAQTILSTLASSLDMRYPISEEIRPLYVFFVRQISEANIKKDAAMVEEILPLLKDMRDSFDQAEKISRREHHLRGRAI